MRSLALSLAILSTLPAAAQPVSPDTVLAYLWDEMWAGTEAAAWGVEYALYQDSAAAAEGSEARAARFRRGIVTASHAASASAGSLSPLLQMTIALAEPARQAEVEAALGGPATALYYALAAIVDEAANVAESDTPPDDALRDAWRQHAAIVRAALELLSAAHDTHQP
jgi:hypothetical protein